VESIKLGGSERPGPLLELASVAVPSVDDTVSPLERRRGAELLATEEGRGVVVSMPLAGNPALRRVPRAKEEV